MSPFTGFDPGRGAGTPVPDRFFAELLPVIDHLGELKVTLYVFWRLHRTEGPFPHLWLADILEDSGFLGSFGADAEAAVRAVREGLDRCVARGSLLQAEIQAEGTSASLYLLNSPRGKAALQAIQSGTWNPVDDPQPPPDLGRVSPDIFKLYEDHIGPLTPMIAETLAEAEETYPSNWIEEAFRIAVENNVRRWRYVVAILRTWQEEGRDERKSQRDPETDRRRYVRGKFSEFVEH